MRHTFAQWIPAFPEHYKGQPWTVRFNRDHLNGYWMDEGEQIQNWDPSLEAVSSDGPDVSLDFMFADHAWPLFSKRLQLLLNDGWPETFQFLPFTFSPKDKSYVNADFSVGQCLHLVDGLDRDRTGVDNDDWTPRANGTLRVNYPYYVIYNRVKNCPAFRLVGSAVQLFIRNDVQQAILESGYTGSRFDQNHPICTFDKD